MRPRRCAVGLVLVTLLGPASAEAPLEGPGANEPVLPLPAAPAPDARRAALGEALFADPRLSASGRTSCTSCHDLSTNGASARARDVGDGGRALRFNTPTIFNVGHSFKLNWEGRVDTVPELVENSLRGADLMGGAGGEAVERLRRDGATARRFQEAYGRPPDGAALVDALSTYVATLTTPDSPFDRWLAGDPGAIGPRARSGYRLFRSLGCASCHQGANVGANLSQRHGIFSPLASPDPPILRVPSLRNVAVTAPYFHDGSAETLDQAVRAMARAQLDRSLEPGEVDDIAAFLCSLTGRYRGAPLSAPAGSARACAAP